MTIGIREFKAGALALLIAAALCLQGARAGAAERETLVVAGGCFWCVEADFEKVAGVIGAESGFAGGDVANPTYKQVTRGGTGHLEAVRIRFDPARVSRAALLDLFLRSIDPTDAGGQFCDRGESYTTAIFVSDPAEKTLAESAIREAGTELGQKIVTPVRRLDRFWPAERRDHPHPLRAADQGQRVQALPRGLRARRKGASALGRRGPLCQGVVSSFFMVKILMPDGGAGRTLSPPCTPPAPPC